jgi:hypothetical protein
MVLILLRDGSHIEVPHCTDVIRKLSFLFCVDALDAPLLCLSAEDVLAYTMNCEVAHHLVCGEEDEALKRGRFGRKRTRKESDESSRQIAW